MAADGAPTRRLAVASADGGTGPALLLHVALLTARSVSARAHTSPSFGAKPGGGLSRVNASLTIPTDPDAR
jgi:hypothetical protein